MQPYIQVKFEGMPRDPSVEASVHRWVARLEAVSTIHRASITIQQAGRRCTAVSLRLDLLDGSGSTSSALHGEIYVAVAEAFRTARRQLLARTAAAGQGRFAMRAA